MIEIDDDWCATKVITPIVHDELEKSKVKKEFVILTPTKTVAFVPTKTLIKQKFVIETTGAHDMT